MKSEINKLCVMAIFCWNCKEHAISYSRDGLVIDPLHPCFKCGSQNVKNMDIEIDIDELINRENFHESISKKICGGIENEKQT